MTVYSVTISPQYTSTNPSTFTTQNINSTDTISITVDTSSFATMGSWSVYSSTNCTVTPTTGADGGTATLTPTSGATSYTVVFRTLNGDISAYVYGKLAGSISSTADTTPDAFTFTDQTGVALNTTVTSNTITVSGITAATAISITGGTYSINGGAYTSSSGTITNGQTVTVQHTSSSSFSTAVNTTLTIGGVSDVFTSTTLAADTTPDTFTFTDQTNVALSSTITSNAITVSGINTASTISITGGTYSINGGAYTSATGTITNGQTVTVQHTSSASNSTATNTTLTIGGVSDTFTSTTLAVAPDTTPDAFSFTDQTGVALSTVITSAAITVSGINTASAISITGGTYSINGGAYTSTAGTVTNGQAVTVRHTSSASFSTATNTTLTIGGVSDVFTSTTGAADTTPNAFSFTDQTNVTINTLITSNTITISGLTAAATVTVTGGEYSINSGAYTAAVGSITNLQTISVRHTSSSTTGTATNTTLNIGGVSDIFTSTTTSSGSSYILTPSDTVARAGRQLTVDLYTSDANVLYWTINTTTANFLTVQGTTQGLLYGIGIFVITPTLTCTAGTYTVSLRTGSYTGTVVASFNVQVEATLSAATHGIIVNDSSGTAILDTTYDTTRFLGSYTMTTAYTNASTTPPYVDPPIQTNKGVFVFSPSFVSSSRLGPPSYIIGTDPSGNQPYVKNRIYFTSDALPSSGSLVYLYGEY